MKHACIFYIDMHLIMVEKVADAGGREHKRMKDRRRQRGKDEEGKGGKITASSALNQT